jgi:L-amino acid N-acyltransferase YncA
VTPPSIRDGRSTDTPAIAAICGHWVAHGLASFEFDTPDTPEIAHAGHPPAIGRKHGRGVDSVLMTRPLGPDSATAPEG